MKTIEIQEKTTQTLSFQLEVNEYERLQDAAEMWGHSEQRMMDEFINCDLGSGLAPTRFQAKDEPEECYTFAYQVSPQRFQAIKERQRTLGMTTQDYLRTLVRWLTNKA